MAEQPEEYHGLAPGLTRSDPSALTTDQLRRELASLSDQLSERIAGVVNMVGARLDAIDKATALFEANLTRIPNSVDRAVDQLKELNAEKFASVRASIADLASLGIEKFDGIQKQFQERDTRVEQTARDTKVAVDAALQAAEKAVGKQNESFALSIAKSETATTKQIDQLSTIAAGNGAAIDGKIGDLKDRVSRIENQAIGWASAETKQSSETTTHQGASNVVVGLVGVAVLIVSLLLSHVSVWR
jgi:hypothetical protein